MTDETKGPPPGWGDDGLTKYLDTTRENQFATFYGRRPGVNGLIRIDKAFRTLFIGAVNVRPWFPVQFILRAHSAFTMASGAAMAGQHYEINSVLRSCLELAGYGLYIGADTKRAEVWLRRHDDEDTMRDMKSEFTVRNIKGHIRAMAPKVADHFETLYDHMIDYGGHPNERGFYNNMKIAESDDQTEIQSIYLQDDPIQFDMALKRTGQVGLWVLIASQFIWKERFELLGLRQEIDQLKKMY